MKRASETPAEELAPENSERPSSFNGVVIPSDVPGTMDFEDVNAVPSDVGGENVSSFQSSRDFAFGELRYR